MRKLPALLLLAACSSTPAVQPEIAANRDDVIASLYRQLDLVLARQAELASEQDEAALRERAELTRLAAEIAIRILRIDPDADGRALVTRIDQAR